MLLVLAVLLGCSAPAHNRPAASANPTRSVDASGRTVPVLPNPALTPGDTLDVPVQAVCTPGYSESVRNVTQQEKRQVYAEYGIAHRDRGEFEVDHLISLELGGSNSIRNLWPESYTTQPWNAHVKDELENELHREVCEGRIDLRTAQHDIAADWIASYKRYFHTDAPLHSGGAAEPATPGRTDRQDDAGTSAAPPAPAEGNVWVNTRSGKYFRSGSRYYGNTRQGEFMSEAEARRQGFTAARRPE